MSEALKHAVSRVAGQTIFGGLGAMGYAAVLLCWLSETISRRSVTRRTLRSEPPG